MDSDQLPTSDGKNGLGANVRLRRESTTAIPSFQTLAFVGVQPPIDFRPAATRRALTMTWVLFVDRGIRSARIRDSASYKTSADVDPVPFFNFICELIYVPYDVHYAEGEREAKTK